MVEKTNRFTHLAASASDEPLYQNESQQTTGKVTAGGSYHISKQHSRGHNVAVSEEAKQSPVLAVQLLRTTDLNSVKIRSRLSADPEALSKFTSSFMEDNEPGWEFLDEDEKAHSAQQFSLQNADKNGYRLSRERAVKTLKSMEEPLTDDEKSAMIENLRQERNATDPNTPDNVAAREQAEDEYREQVAKAIVARNNQLRATGVALPGDTRRANGQPQAPYNEIQMIKTGLRSGAIGVQLTSGTAPV